jgi:GT2 family glycosyltransferase
VSRIGVVTVTYNSGQVLRPFLECALAQDHADWVLYVVDNASRDGTRSILGSMPHPSVRTLLNDANLGVAEGNNQGIRAALADGCDHVLLINNDVEFPPTLYSALLRSLGQHRADAVTPRITYHDEPGVDWFNGGSFKYLRGPDARHDPPGRPGQDAPRRIGYAPTCCMLVRREVFEVVGLMDPQYFVYWDDTDFCLRMQRAGLTLVCDPTISMSHKVSSLTGGLTSDFFLRYHHRNQVYYVRKHFNAAVLAYTLVMSMTWALARIPLKGDTLRQFRLRLRSAREGLGLSLAAPLAAVASTPESRRSP